MYGAVTIYGWYLQNREDVRAAFDAWLEPLKPIGTRRNVSESIGNSDHVTFNDAGVPGFNALQDYTNYDVCVHHTNMDTVERVESRTSARRRRTPLGFAYSAAQAERKIPRPAAK